MSMERVDPLDKLAYWIGRFDRRYRTHKAFRSREEYNDWRKGWLWNWRAAQYTCTREGEDSPWLLGVIPPWYLRLFWRYIYPRLRRATR